MNKEITRQQHIIWTISGRYNIKARSLFLDNIEYESTKNIKLIVIGGIYRYIPKGYIDDYLLRVVGLGDSTKYYVELFLCLAQEYVLPKLSRRRRYLQTLEKIESKKIFDELSKAQINIERDKLLYTYYSYKAGNKYDKFDIDYQIVNTIKKVKYVKNAYEFMKHLYSIFDIYLGGIPKKYESQSLINDEEDYQLHSEVLKKSESNIYDDDKEDPQVFAAEFNHNIMEEEVDAQLEFVDELLLFSNHVDSKVMYDKILANYGPSKFSDRQRFDLEKVLSRDNHRGCKIHYSNEFMSKSRGYKKEYMIEQYDANKRFYDENINLFEANIKNLITLIREKILINLEETYYNLDRGIMDRKNIYRYIALNDNKIFLKKYKEEVGSIALTILIDSSGSQLARQKQVASWTYILAQAFMMCSIPTRVVGFNNLFDYTVFREYRDFNDPISKNKDIFYFLAEGSNRDGMAINTISHLINYRQESKKLLIVLSDGKPNDVRIGVASHMVSGHDTSEYTGLHAIEDTARIVRRCRAEGVNIIGVYTGEKDDIQSQKLIYGKDFAYVPDINHMGIIVGKAIESVIQDKLY